ncbi:hypothetical protein ACHWQZ_G017377 [Mnemiopsis leidyi]
MLKREESRASYIQLLEGQDDSKGKMWNKLTRGFAVKRRTERPVRRKSSGIKFTEEEFQTAFQLFDKDGDGSISREEIETVLESLGQHVTPEDLDKILGEIDVDGDGTISLNEFKTMMERLMETNEQDDRQLLEDSFHEFDVYGNGLIGVEDLLYVFRKLGDDEITREEVEMMIIDATGTAKRKEVTLEEFKAVSKGF